MQSNPRQIRTVPYSHRTDRICESVHGNEGGPKGVRGQSTTQAALLEILPELSNPVPGSFKLLALERSTLALRQSKRNQRISKALF